MNYELFCTFAAILEKVMEKNEDLRLQKTRSTRAIISDGYRLYTKNFKRLFRASWPMAVIYALMFALMTSRVIYDVLPLVTILATEGTLSSQWMDIPVACPLCMLSILLFAVSALLLASCGFWAFRSHKVTSDIPRAMHWWGVWPGKWYPGMLWKGIRWFLTVGLRHLGILFATLLITMIITMLLTLFCEFPAFIIGTANIKAYMGAAMGDPLGMPDYLPTLTFIAFAIAGFVQAYAHLATLFPLYYAYGSIETLVKEKKAINI